MTLDFRERAKRLGHSLELLDAGIPVTTTITVTTPEQLKDVITTFNPRSGPDLAKMLFGDIPISDPEEDGSVAGTLRRLNEFVYGDAPLSDKDRVRVKNAFPLHLQASSYPNYTPDKPVIYDNAQQPQALNAGTLTLNNGIYISVYQSVFTMCVDDLVRNGNNGNPAIGDINIFGHTGAAGATAGPGSTGATGSAGSASSCTVGGTEPGANGGPGGTGGVGHTGGQGGDGQDGKPSYQATISINKSISGDNPHILIFSRSGTGGSGNDGAQGGRGGTGGNGAAGANCACTGTNGGNAGTGGDGGMGGTGGNGGNGVDKAGDVAVFVAKAFQNNVKGNTAPAPPGASGQGGLGGAPGQPGSAGAAGKTGSGGGGANKGITGSTGPHGKAGTIYGKAATININPI